MTLDEIKALPVQEIAAEDSVIFLWATFPMLNEALTVMEAWGFKYKTVGFTWVKRTKKGKPWNWGMGNWTRSNAEVCLLGVRGKPKRVSAGVHSVLDDPIGRHSEKPDTARQRIVKLLGDVPRIELFAREKAPGWDVWGNEVQSDIWEDVDHGQST